jgi:outer membrane protein assembly factor BamA
VDATYILLRERVLKRVANNLFFGPEVDYQQLLNTKFIQPEEGPPIAVPPGAEGTRNVGLGAGLVFDNRHNVLNVRNGAFAELSGLDYRPKWGAQRRFYGVTIDFRGYKALDKRRVLAGQIFGQSFTGDLPFNQMALMGGETIMRGYYSGRYRDKEMIAAQLEHRWLPFAFSRRFGAAVFMSAAAVAPAFSDYNFRKTRMAGGAGLRYLLFPNKDVYLRFDLGVNSDGGFGFYIFTGEAF